jgi:hypothetical protein
VISDGLEDGKVVSGVGGQFNFVTQAFALADARSVLTLQATRWSKGEVESNIVWSFSHETIPRHLRDIIITEYGIADLRGRPDGEVIAQMLSITDSRFQQGLLQMAKHAGKIDKDYEIPEAYRNNSPGRVKRVVSKWRDAGYLPVFPFGSDFTEIEQRLLPALSEMARTRYSKRQMFRLARAGWGADSNAKYDACIQRMGLDQPRGLKERLYRLLLLGALARVRDGADQS